MEPPSAGHPLIASLVGVKGLLIGVVANFYIILVVAIVQDLVLSVDAHEALLTGTQMALFSLATALVLMAVSYFGRWSWPILSEKALFVIIVWLSRGLLISNFDLCVCCTGGRFYAYCGAPWITHLLSLLWLVVLAASFCVDAYAASVRNASIAILWVAGPLLIVAPPNTCNTLPMSTVAIFLRISAFSVVWHFNRMLRIGESALYALATRYFRYTDSFRIAILTTESEHHMARNRSRAAAVSSPALIEEVALDSPQDLLCAWQVFTAIYHRLLSGSLKDERLYSDFLGIRTHSGQAPADKNGRALDAASRLVELIEDTRKEIPSLDACTGAPGADTAFALGPGATWIDWKYRDYSHELMLGIDLVRAAWVLGVCLPYVVFLVAELAWLAVVIYRTISELFRIQLLITRVQRREKTSKKEEK